MIARPKRLQWSSALCCQIVDPLCKNRNRPKPSETKKSRRPINNQTILGLGDAADSHGSLIPDASGLARRNL
jgi:hypothetical protein